MTLFSVLGATMALAALAFVLWPFLRAASGRRWGTIALSIAGIPLLAAGLYLTLSDYWRSPAPGQERSDVPPMVLEMVASLEQKMKNDPSNLEGWLKLGRSYFQLGDYAKSAGAYQHAYTLSRGGNAEATLGLAEAMLLQDEVSLIAPATRLFEEGYALEPANPKALWYTGLMSYQQGHWTAAHERWSSLAALEIPAEFRQVLRARLSEIEGRMTAPESGTKAPAAGSSTR